MESLGVSTANPSAAVSAAAAPLLKWVGEKLAGGVVGTIAGRGFNELLSALGLVSSGPNLSEMLQEVGAKIDEVQLSLDRLYAMTGTLLNEVQYLKEFITASLQEDKLNNAILEIDTVCGGLPTPFAKAVLRSGGAAVSLYDLTVVLPAAADATPASLRADSQRFASYAEDMPLAINTIHSVLTSPTYGKESLLGHWSQTFIREIRSGAITQEKACSVLEGYFLQAIAAQLKGVNAHCVALGARDTSAKEMIAHYLTGQIGPKMRKQTLAYVQAVESVLFGTLPPTMTVGAGLGGGEVREFPKKIEALLLRADLVAAALNLAGTTAPEKGVALHQAIQGVYGRVLYRPCDLDRDGVPRKKPALKGYTEQQVSACEAIPLPCISISQAHPQEVPVIADVAASRASVVRCCWLFGANVPTKGEGIDPGQRGGVVPELHEVFGPETSEPPVLAASFLDVAHLYRSIPHDKEVFQSYVHEFGGQGYKYAAIVKNRRSCNRNPFSEGDGPALEWNYEVHHAKKANITFESGVGFRLFTYRGAKAKVRMTAFIHMTLWRGSRMDAYYMPFQHRWIPQQKWDLIEELDVRRDGAPVCRLYDSHQAYGNPSGPMSLESPQALSNLQAPYRNEGAVTVSQPFELLPGTYELTYRQHAWIPQSSADWKDWNKSEILFRLNKVALELVL